MLFIISIILSIICIKYVTTSDSDLLWPMVMVLGVLFVFGFTGVVLSILEPSSLTNFHLIESDRIDLESSHDVLVLRNKEPDTDKHIKMKSIIVEDSINYVEYNVYKPNKVLLLFDIYLVQSQTVYHIKKDK